MMSREFVRGDRAEVFFHHLKRFRRVDVSHDGDDRVVRRMVLFEEGLQIIRRKKGYIRRPADDGPPVRACGKRRGQEQLHQLAGGNRLVGLAALLDHDIPLGVELPQDRVRHPVGLDAGPELDAVGRQAHLVGRHILTGRCIEVRSPVFRVEPIDLVFDDPLLGLALKLLQLLRQSLDLASSARAPFIRSRRGPSPSRGFSSGPAPLP